MTDNRDEGCNRCGDVTASLIYDEIEDDWVCRSCLMKRDEEADGPLETE